MRNRYLETNFRDSRSDYSDCDNLDVTRSNAMYDQHVFITHAFIPEVLPDGTEMKRLVTDVEIAMSTIGSVKAVVSDEYQQRMRLGLMNQPRNPARVGNVSDDDLIAELIPPCAEPDEVAAYAKAQLSNIQARPTDPPVAPVDPPVAPADSDATE